MRGLVYLTVSNELHPNVKKCLIEIVQILQVYARLTELELAAGEEGPKVGPLPVALPGDVGEKVREWVDGEEAKVREKEEERAEGKRALSEAAGLAESVGYDAEALRGLAGERPLASL